MGFMFNDDGTCGSLPLKSAKGERAIAAGGSLADRHPAPDVMEGHGAVCVFAAR